MRVSRLTLLIASIAVCVASCRPASSDESETLSGGFSGNRVDVTGSITSQTGSQSQMAGWSVVLLERDSGIARVAEADASGNLAFGKVSLSAVQTVILLSPDYLLQSVLTMPSTKEKTVKQYFTLNKPILPRLVQKGGTVTFQTTEGITILEDTASDDDADTIPDGMASLGLAPDGTEEGFALETIDSDKDGIMNSSDPDIDGDGIVNAFDLDDDGDGTQDEIDSDANGDGVADASQSNSDQHYSVGLEYLAVQNVTNSSSRSLKFVAKVRDGSGVKQVKVRGASNFLTGASYTTPAGASGDWDLTLADDGLNDDAAAGDLLFVRNVNLASDVSPRANQAIFIQLVIGEGAEQFTAEFPYIFPNLEAAVPTTSYNTSTRIVTLAGDPFGASLQNFSWTVSLRNSTGVKVYESNPIKGSTRTMAIPSNVLVSGQTYTYSATVQLMDKVPGYPSMVVRSDDGTISP